MTTVWKEMSLTVARTVDVLRWQEASSLTYQYAINGILQLMLCYRGGVVGYRLVVLK